MSSHPDGRLLAFEAERARRSDEVYTAHRGLVKDYREEYPWVTGALGNPYADVWFVAENPSLTQVKRVRNATPESQWAISRADGLFRDVLLKHGFKDPPRDAPGGWRCYITDVVKSPDLAGGWDKLARDEQMEVAKAWAPVLAWELGEGRPLLVVSIGKDADKFLDRLEKSGDLPTLPDRVCVPHYSYVMHKPEGRRGPGHPERVAEYDQHFAHVAARAVELSASRHQILRAEDGREVDLGTEQELWAANHDIFNATGGSSGRGKFSMLFGLRPDDAMPTEWATRLGTEAAEFIELYELLLRRETVALLEQLSALTATSSPSAT
jgi:hypothetical protein